jgi:poly(A) polymerase
MKSAAQSGDRFAVYIKILDKFKILKHVLPELVQLKYMKHQLRHHPEGPTVWDHVIAALETSQTKDPLKNLAILLHDIGKGISLSYKEGLPVYIRHAHAGISMVNAIADRLKFSNKERQALIFAIGNHMKMHDVLSMKPSKVAKLVTDDNWDVLVAVAYADEHSRGETFMHAGQFEKIIDKCVKIKDKFGINDVEKKLKLVDGHHVMTITGLKPGKKVGDIIRKTTTWIIDNDIEKQEEIDKYIKKLV